MKHLISTGVALLFLAVHSFGQDATPKTTTTTHTKTTHKHSSHKSSKHHSSHASSKTKTSHTTAIAAPKEGATMNPTSGSASNGAGKSARIQTTTKEKADNLNDMDKSRNQDKLSHRISNWYTLFIAAMGLCPQLFYFVLSGLYKREKYLSCPQALKERNKIAMYARKIKEVEL